MLRRSTGSFHFSAKTARSSRCSGTSRGRATTARWACSIWPRPAASMPSPPTAFCTRNRRDAAWWTSSPACVITRRSLSPAACSWKTPSVISSGRRPWKPFSPTGAMPFATPRPCPIVCVSPSMIWVTVFPTIRCRRGKPTIRSFAPSRKRALTIVIGRITTRPARRSRRNSRSSPSWASPGTSSSCGISCSFARPVASSPRAGVRPRTARSATASASPPSIRWGWNCCSRGSCPRNGASGPTSTSTCLRATGARRSSSTSIRSTARTARP